MVIPEGSYRQFFRLVTSQVSLWYKDHSTPNPLGVKPDPDVTQTVVGDKFGREGVEVVRQSGAIVRKNFRRFRYSLKKLLKD